MRYLIFALLLIIVVGAVIVFLPNALQYSFRPSSVPKEAKNLGSLIQPGLWRTCFNGEEGIICASWDRTGRLWTIGLYDLVTPSVDQMYSEVDDSRITPKSDAFKHVLRFEGVRYFPRIVVRSEAPKSILITFAGTDCNQNSSVVVDNLTGRSGEDLKKAFDILSMESEINRVGEVQVTEEIRDQVRDWIDRKSPTECIAQRNFQLL